MALTPRSDFAWLDAHNRKPKAELLLFYAVDSVQASTKVVGIMLKCSPFSILCAKSVIIHTSIACMPIKTGVGVNCDIDFKHIPVSPF